MRTKIQLLAILFCLLSLGNLLAQVSGNALFVKATSAIDTAILLQHKGVTVQNLGANKYLVCIGDNDVYALKAEAATLANVQYVASFTIKGKKIAAETGRLIIKLKQDASADELANHCKTFGLVDFKKAEWLRDTYLAQNTLGGQDNNSICKALLATGLCKYAEPEMAFSPIVPSTPNDPVFIRQWALLNTGVTQQGSGTPGVDMNVTEAWDITQGSPEIQIAVIDAGVDTLHPDLMANLLDGFDAGNETDVTHGYPTPNYDEDGHGTCCAGIACAVANNDIGTAGVAPLCQIIPIRMFYYLSFNGQTIPFSTTLYAANSVSWAWQNGADIISNSWGVPDSLLAIFGDPQSVYDAIMDAHTLGRGGVGCVQLYSSGNDDSSYVLLPGRLPEVIAVGATSMCDERKSPTSCDNENWWGGNYGDSLDISAPGVRIPAPDMLGTNGFVSGSYYNYFNGTSSACPNAAGVVALILSVSPHLTGTQARYILESTADRVGGYDYSAQKASGSWSFEMGYGRVNALAAVQAAQATAGVSDSKPKNFTAFIYTDNAGNPYLNMLANKPENVTVEVYDITGRYLQTTYHGTTAQLSNIPLNINTAGMYLVHVTVGNEVQGIKVVKR